MSYYKLDYKPGNVIVLRKKGVHFIGDDVPGDILVIHHILNDSYSHELIPAKKFHCDRIDRPNPLRAGTKLYLLREIYPGTFKRKLIIHEDKEYC